MSRSLSLLGGRSCAPALATLELLLGAICALTLSACSKQEPPVPTPAQAAEPTPIPAATAPAAPASEPPAESSLALKRGLLSLATEQATFKPCGEETQLWVID